MPEGGVVLVAPGYGMYGKRGAHDCPTLRTLRKTSLMMSQRLSLQSSASQRPPLLHAFWLGYMACLPSAAVRGIRVAGYAVPVELPPVGEGEPFERAAVQVEDGEEVLRCRDPGKGPHHRSGFPRSDRSRVK